MSIRRRDPPESIRDQPGYEPEQRQHTRHACDLPLRIAVVESLTEPGPTVIRVVSGRQYDVSTTGAGFICPVRLPGSEVILELRSLDNSVSFETARIVHESQTTDGRWRYGAVFVPAVDRVDRYEFD